MFDAVQNGQIYSKSTAFIGQSEARQTAVTSSVARQLILNADIMVDMALEREPNFLFSAEYIINSYLSTALLSTATLQIFPAPFEFNYETCHCDATTYLAYKTIVGTTIVALLQIITHPDSDAVLAYLQHNVLKIKLQLRLQSKYFIVLINQDIRAALFLRVDVTTTNEGKR
jgi:hypothetical protein